MKFIFVLLSVLLFVSCTSNDTSPIFDDPEDPFVVKRIERLDNGLVAYISDQKDPSAEGGIGETYFVARNSIYRISDTVRIGGYGTIVHTDTQYKVMVVDSIYYTPKP